MLSLFLLLMASGTRRETYFAFMDLGCVRLGKRLALPSTNLLLIFCIIKRSG